MTSQEQQNLIDSLVCPVLADENDKCYSPVLYEDRYVLEETHRGTIELTGETYGHLVEVKCTKCGLCWLVEN